VPPATAAGVLLVCAAVAGGVIFPAGVVAAAVAVALSAD